MRANTNRRCLATNRTNVSIVKSLAGKKINSRQQAMSTLMLGDFQSHISNLTFSEQVSFCCCFPASHQMLVYLMVYSHQLCHDTRGTLSLSDGMRCHKGRSCKRFVLLATYKYSTSSVQPMRNIRSVNALKMCSMKLFARFLNDCRRLFILFTSKQNPDNRVRKHCTALVKRVAWSSLHISFFKLIIPLTCSRNVSRQKVH